MDETDNFISNSQFIVTYMDKSLSPGVKDIITRRIRKLEAENDPNNELYIRILYTILDRNTVGIARRAEHIAMFFGALGAIFYILRVTMDGGLSIWSQLFWAFDASILIFYFYETRQCPIMLPQLANVILSIISVISILQHYPDAWSQW